MIHIPVVIYPVGQTEVAVCQRLRLTRIPKRIAWIAQNVPGHWTTTLWVADVVQRVLCEIWYVYCRLEWLVMIMFGPYQTAPSGDKLSKTGTVGHRDEIKLGAGWTFWTLSPIRSGRYKYDLIFVNTYVLLITCLSNTQVKPGCLIDNYVIRGQRYVYHIDVWLFLTSKYSF